MFGNCCRKISELQAQLQQLEKYGDIQSICAKLEENSNLKKVSFQIHTHEKQVKIGSKVIIFCVAVVRFRNFKKNQLYVTRGKARFSFRFRLKAVLLYQIKRKLLSVAVIGLPDFNLDLNEF